MNSLAIAFGFSSLLCGTSMSGGLFYKPGTDEVLINPDLMFYCADTTQSCQTLFGKNVFATDDPIADRQWTQQLFPDMYNQFDDTFDCGSGSKLISMDTCAQLHQPQTLYHGTGDLEVSDLQTYYKEKWSNALSNINNGNMYYDAFFDNSVAYWVADLADYHTIWTDANADIVFLKWKISISSNTNSNIDDKDKYYYSMITHNGNSMIGDGASTLSQYELISDTFTGLDEFINNGKVIFIESEQRAYFDLTLNDGSKTYTDVSTGCLAYPIGVRRGVSNLEENIEWYKTIFSATITDDSQIIIGEYISEDTNTLIKYGHLRLYNSRIAPSISFFERKVLNNNIDSSHGSLQVTDLETELNSVHEEYMLSPFCGIDRWFDMHYAMDFNDLASSEAILESIMASGYKYTLFGNSYYRFLYMPEPNGHSVQVMFESKEIDFAVEPNDWDPNWCPIECSDEQLSYNFGESVVNSYGDSDDSLAARAAAKKQEERRENVSPKNKNINKKNNNKMTQDTALTAIGLACAIIILLYVVFTLVFKKIDKNSKLFIDNNENQNERQRLVNTEYGTVTF